MVYNNRELRITILYMNSLWTKALQRNGSNNRACHDLNHIHAMFGVVVYRLKRVVRLRVGQILHLNPTKLLALIDHERF